MENSQLITRIYIDWNKVDENSYVRNIDALKGLEMLDFDHSVTFFVGENGSGKSTLLEAIAIAAGFNPEGGTLNYIFSTYDDFSDLCNAITLARSARKRKWGYFLRAESFYNVATKEEEYGRELGCSEHYHAKSHGESFLALLQNNFNASGLYLLDEPEAALSPQRQLTLLIDIYNAAKEGAQFIIASHSPILLAIPNAQILSFDGPIHSCSYEKTDSYKITSMFINNREQILHNLLEGRE